MRYDTAKQARGQGSSQLGEPEFHQRPEVAPQAKPGGKAVYLRSIPYIRDVGNAATHGSKAQQQRSTMKTGEAKNTSILDSRAFLSALDAVRKERNLSWYHVAMREAHIANISLIVSGKRTISIATAQKLAQWAGLDLAKYQYQAVRHA